MLTNVRNPRAIMSAGSSIFSEDGDAVTEFRRDIGLDRERTQLAKLKDLRNNPIGYLEEKLKYKGELAKLSAEKAKAKFKDMLDEGMPTNKADEIAKQYAQALLKVDLMDINVKYPFAPDDVMSRIRQSIGSEVLPAAAISDVSNLKAGAAAAVVVADPNE